MAQLFEHQMQALKNMKNGCILCGDVGTGKSMTSLAYYLNGMCEGGQFNKDGSFRMPKVMRSLYIITTAKKRDDKEWDKELQRWGLSRDKGASYRGTEVVVDSWNNIGKYRKVFGAAFIFDEQRVIGSGSWVKAFLDIARKNKWILLSATPGDCWKDYIPVFIANGFYKNKTEFAWRHIVYEPFIKRYPKIRCYINTDILERHRKEVVVLMNFDKLTTAHHENILVQYDCDLYNKVWKEYWNPYENKPIKQVSEKYMLARKVVNSDPARIEAVEDIMAKHPSAIIFYNFNFELDILRDICKRRGWLSKEWNGTNHDPLPDQTEEWASGKYMHWFYFVQYAAGSEGWECTTTNCMIFYSQTYRYTYLRQACGRIDRINTGFKDLYYYHVLSHAVIDKGIKTALNRKEDFNEAIFEREEANDFGEEEAWETAGSQTS